MRKLEGRCNMESDRVLINQIMSWNEFYEFLKGSKCKDYLAPITFVYDWDSPQTGGNL